LTRPPNLDSRRPDSNASPPARDKDFVAYREIRDHLWQHSYQLEICSAERCYISDRDPIGVSHVSPDLPSLDEQAASGPSARQHRGISSGDPCRLGTHHFIGTGQALGIRQLGTGPRAFKRLQTSLRGRVAGSTYLLLPKRDRSARTSEIDRLLHQVGGVLGQDAVPEPQLPNLRDQFL
jgi:hypothetical protein